MPELNHTSLFVAVVIAFLGLMIGLAKGGFNVLGALYVLFDGKQTYTLSDQQAPEKFAGKKVMVAGTLDAKSNTIRVDSISAAK